MSTSTLRQAAPAAVPAEPLPGLDELVFAERIALLHARSVVAQITVVVNATVVAAVFWRLSPRAPALAWLVALCSLAVARGLAVRAYRSRPRAPAEAAAWARLFVAGAALNGAGWGAVALLFYVPGATAHQLFLAFVLGGMAAGAASSNASYTPAFAAFTVPALVPMIARFAGERDALHVAMAFMLAVFAVAVAAISRTGGRAIEDATRLRFRNEALVVRLEAAQERVEALNAALERRVADRTAELERMLAARRESEAHLARFRALLDQSGEAILVARVHDLTVVDANARAAELLGCDVDALLGARLDEPALVPALQGAAARAVVDSLSPGDVRTLEGRRSPPGGRPRDLELSVAVRDVGGERYVLVTARDVSARKEMEHELTQAGLLASVGSLAAGVAHEINNPLAYILANLEHLWSRLGDASGLPLAERSALREVVADSLEGAERVRRIVRDLWSLSPHAHEEQESVDVRAVLESCISVAMNEIRHRATLVRELGDVPPVVGDRTRLAQVLLNLLVNAAQAIPEGNASAQRITVRARLVAASGTVEVDVADTGAGIPAANLHRIFEPFFTTKPVGRGMGLGLSICHGIVAALGGRLTVQSREGEGSTFTVALRAARPGAVAPPPRAASAPEPDRKARLLVIDDDPGVARALHQVLAQHEVTVAIGGGAGLAALERSTFDAVLCDVMMPDVSGMDVHRRMRELRPGSERTVVFVTGGAFTDAASAFLESVPNPCITKPFKAEEVRAAVRLVLASPAAPEPARFA
jgi:PAS domain S-box-containing protein